jgi:hypothetical protein
MHIHTITLLYGSSVATEAADQVTPLPRLQILGVTLRHFGEQICDDHNAKSTQEERS